MGETASGWEVIDADAGILTRAYEFRKDAEARMVTGRCADGSLFAVSPAPGVPREALAELSAYGTVSALIAPNGMHYMGVPEWKRAYPDARIYAPERAARRITKKRPDLTAIEPTSRLALFPGLELVDVPSQKIGETWLIARCGAGTVWYVSDSCFSMGELPKPWLGRTIFRLTRSAPGFRINRVSLWMFAEDKPGYARFILEQLERHPPDVVMTAHGDVMRGPGLDDQLRAQVAEAF